MYDSLACRLCLATDVRLTAIANTSLQDTYEKLTDTALNSAEKPLAACYLCIYQLRKYQEFAERVSRVDVLLTRMLRAGTDVTLKSIAMIDRAAHKLTANLAIAPIEFYNLHDCQPVLEIKHETPVEMEVITGDVGVMRSEHEGISTINPELHNTIDQNKIKQAEPTEKYSKKNPLISSDNRKNINNEWILPDHIENEDAIKAKVYYNCDLCPYQSATRDSLEKHIITHSNGTSFCIQNGSSESEICDNQINNLDLSKTATREIPSESTINEHTSNVKSDLKQHLEIRSRRRLYKCTVCEYICGQKGNLEKHLRIHTGEKPYKCMICDYRSSVKGTLKSHMRIHTGEKPYECSVCKYRSSQKSAVKQHLRIHTGEKPHKCTICKYRCNRKGDLDQHLRTHTGEKPFKCTVCEYRCSQRSALNEHFKTHTGEKPYECIGCHKKFSKLYTLRVHSKIHA